DVVARPAHVSVHVLQLRLALDFDAEMIEPRLTAARGDREIDAWIVEHPFGIVGLDHGGSGREQGRGEPDRARDIVDRDVNMHALHASPLLSAFLKPRVLHYQIVSVSGRTIIVGWGSRICPR